MSHSRTHYCHYCHPHCNLLFLINISHFQETVTKVTLERDRWLTRANKIFFNQSIHEKRDPNSISLLSPTPINRLLSKDLPQVQWSDIGDNSDQGQRSPS